MKLLFEYNSAYNLKLHTGSYCEIKDYGKVLSNLVRYAYLQMEDEIQGSVEARCRKMRNTFPGINFNFKVFVNTSDDEDTEAEVTIYLEPGDSSTSTQSLQPIVEAIAKEYNASVDARSTCYYIEFVPGILSLDAFENKFCEYFDKRIIAAYEATMDELRVKGYLL